jgi:argininosuccinate lyase
VDTLIDTYAIFAEMMGSHVDAQSGERIFHVTVKADRMRQAAIEGFATATDLADYLVKKGLPFREAHEAVARAVRAAEQKGCDLADLDLTALQTFSSLIEVDIYQVLTLEGSLAARNHLGGTAPGQVRAAAARARARLG